MSLGALAGSIAGGLLGSAGSPAQSALGWYWSKKAAALNYKYQQKLAENRPSWQREGLERAGLNPILAANSAAGAAGGGLNVTTPTGGDPAAGGIAAAASVAGIASAFAQKDKTKQETKLAEASTMGRNVETMGQYIENENKKKTGQLIEAQTSRERAQTEYFSNLSNKTFNEDYNIQLENIVKAAKTLGFQNFIKENPDAIKEAIAGEYGARAQALAKEISLIAENWSKVASNATDLIPLKKILGSLVNIIGKKKK